MNAEDESDELGSRGEQLLDDMPPMDDELVVEQSLDELRVPRDRLDVDVDIKLSVFPLVFRLVNVSRNAMFPSESRLLVQGILRLTLGSSLFLRS